MNQYRILRGGTLLAINLLFLTVWGFSGIGKLISGMPAWFPDKFGNTVLGHFPGLQVTFWLLAMAELLAFALAGFSLVCGEFIEKRPLKWLPAMLVWSLFVFVQLGFGQWLTAEYNGAFQQFVYFTGTLLALHVVHGSGSRAADVNRT